MKLRLKNKKARLMLNYLLRKYRKDRAWFDCLDQNYENFRGNPFIGDYDNAWAYAKGQMQSSLEALQMAEYVFDYKFKSEPLLMNQQKK